VHDGHERLRPTARQTTTTQSDLRALTLAPYINLCDGSWLRRKRAWCPNCYEEWFRGGHVVYEPLIWTIKVVSVCALHGVPLVHTCPSCNRNCPPLADGSRPGYCGRCLGWLGVCSQGSKGQIDFCDSDGYLSWCAEQIGSLVAASPQIRVPFERDKIARTLSTHMRYQYRVSVSALSEVTNCSRRSITMWLEGSTLPRIESLCRLCFKLGIPLLDLLHGLGSTSISSSAIGTPIQSLSSDDKPQELSSGRPNSLARQAGSISRTTIHGVANRVDECDGRAERDSARNKMSSERVVKEDCLRRALRKALKGDPPRSPRLVAISVGYSSPDRVLKKFPDLCANLTARMKEQATKRCEQIRSTLEGALKLSPPPTLHEVAMMLNMSSSSALRVHQASLCNQLLASRKEWLRKNEEQVKWTLMRALGQNDVPPLKRFCKMAGISIDLVVSRFPEIKQAFDSRYSSLKTTKRLTHIEAFQHEVGRVVRLLRERDEYPSAGRVVNENPHLRYAGWDQLQRAIRLAQSDF